MNPLDLLILAMATWRLASLFANETGPFYTFKKLRDWCMYLCDRYWICREFHLYELLECEWCNSVWFGACLTILYYFAPVVAVWVCLPLALSTFTILVKSLMERRRK